MKTDRVRFGEDPFDLISISASSPRITASRTRPFLWLPLVARWFIALLAVSIVGAACRTPTHTEVGYASVEDAPPAGGGPGQQQQGQGQGQGQFDAILRTLGVGDVIDIRVFQEADLTGTFRISEEGTIDYPFCGRIEASGLSQGALTDRLTACLRNGYLKNPQVTVFLKEFNSQKIFVLGQVNKPGTFLFEDRMSVVQAISLAGGFSKLAAKNSVIVTRRIEENGGGSEKKFKLPVESIAEGRHANFTLQPGDIVYVPESFL